MHIPFPPSLSLSLPHPLSSSLPPHPPSLPPLLNNSHPPSSPSPHPSLTRPLSSSLFTLPPFPPYSTTLILPPHLLSHPPSLTSLLFSLSQAGHTPIHVLVSPEAFRTPRGPSLLALLPSLPSSAVTLATPALVASASDTVSPQVGREGGREGGTDVCVALSDERGVMRMREGWREG